MNNMTNPPVCPQNNLLIEIKEKFNEIVKTESGIEFYQDTSFRPEHFATVLGNVVSVPLEVNGEDWPRRSQIKQIVQPGDEAAFSYLTVFDLAHSDNKEDVYYEDPVEHPALTQYSNKKGEKLMIRYRMRDDRFDAASTNEYGQVIDVKEKMTEVEKENWLGKFALNETNTISYNNLLDINGKEYWRVDYAHVIAVRRGDQLIPVGGNVILDIPKKQKVEQTGNIILLNPIKKDRSAYQEVAQVIAIGDPLEGSPKLSVEPGDHVVFDERFAEEYELWGRPVIVLKQNRLLAKM